MAVNANAPTDTKTAKINQWRKDERSAKSLLTQKLPDSTLMRTYVKPSVKERWDAILVTEYTQEGAFAQTNMRAKKFLLAMKCPEKGKALMVLVVTSIQTLLIG